MFARTIIDSDAFLDMPQSSQLLYFHMSMRADDDGFVNNPRSIMRNVKCSEDDMRVLISKKFIIPFESGIVVIKHWKIHNYIAKDRYKETKYKNEKANLILDENNSYTMSTNCIQGVYELDTQVRLGKESIGKESIDNSISKDILVPKHLVPIQEKWNSLGLSKIRDIKGNRLKLLNARVKQYGIEQVIEAIGNIEKSNFLKGQNKTGWVIVFDWFIKPNNFVKVLEGNYNNKEAENVNRSNSSEDNAKYDWSRFTATEWDGQDVEVPKDI